jgi:HK97 gp10 family phage protein
MVTISVRQQGVDVIISAQGRASQDIQPAVAEFINEKGDKVTEEYRSTVPVVTGELQSSIHGEMTGPLTYTTTADSDHAIFVEEGTSRMSGQHQLAQAFNQIASEIAVDAPAVLRKVTLGE